MPPVPAGAGVGQSSDDSHVVRNALSIGSHRASPSSNAASASIKRASIPLANTTATFPGFAPGSAAPGSRYFRGNHDPFTNESLSVRGSLLLRKGSPTPPSRSPTDMPQFPPSVTNTFVAILFPISPSMGITYRYVFGTSFTASAAAATSCNPSNARARPRATKCMISLLSTANTAAESNSVSA